MPFWSSDSENIIEFCLSIESLGDSNAMNARVRGNCIIFGTE